MKYIEITPAEAKALRGITHDRNSVNRLEHISIMIEDNPYEFFLITEDYFAPDFSSNYLALPIRGTA